VAVETLQVLILFVMIVAVEANLHVGDVSVLLACAGEVAAVTDIAGFLHPRNTQMLLVRKIQSGQDLRDFGLGNDVTILAVFVVELPFVVVAGQTSLHRRGVFLVGVRRFPNGGMTEIAIETDIQDVLLVTVMVCLPGGEPIG